MRKTFIYENWSTQVFEGFYDSLLYNADTVLNLSIGEPEPPEGYCYEICDWEGFQNEVGNEARRLIWNNVPDEDEIIFDMKFAGISSPRFYNFSTDRLDIEVDVDVDNLCRWCLDTHREEFNQYLNDNFTSYDGFISFVENNAEQFEQNFIAESDSSSRYVDRYLNVMLEFYILGLDYMQERNGDFSSYRYDLYDYVSSALWPRLCLEKDGKFYEYTVSDDESTVIVGDEIKPDSAESK